MKLTKLIKSVIVFTSLFFVGAANAAQVSRTIPYYGEEFYHDLATGVSNQDLATRIKTVLRSFHVPQEGALDQLATSCNGQKGCYSHLKIGYGGARVWMMGKFYLTFDNTTKTYAVKDMYCDNLKTGDDFRKEAPAQTDEGLLESTVKAKDGKWVNRGKAGEHGEFVTKRKADAQRKAIYASGWNK
jgi:hypothetical protein